KHLVGDKKQLARLKPGMIVAINTEDGPRQVMVLKAGKFNVDVDLNHPLAGKTLTFNVTVDGVREASEEEVAHGHAHGVGGHQH
ncbi:MAG: peptidylprolyl isomerase, partial [Oleiphilaceae bacterium]|nr:peptidylprolyl isomerase [Oleiphilaceae bacterium]